MFLQNLCKKELKLELQSGNYYIHVSNKWCDEKNACWLFAAETKSTSLPASVKEIEANVTTFPNSTGRFIFEVREAADGSIRLVSIEIQCQIIDGGFSLICSRSSGWSHQVYDYDHGYPWKPIPVACDVDADGDDQCYVLLNTRSKNYSFLTWLPLGFGRRYEPSDTFSWNVFTSTDKIIEANKFVFKSVS